MSDQAPIVTERPAQADAQSIEQRAGYPIAQISGPNGVCVIRVCPGPYQQACIEAASLAELNPGMTFGVFKLTADYTAQPRKPETPA